MQESAACAESGAGPNVGNVCETRCLGQVLSVPVRTDWLAVVLIVLGGFSTDFAWGGAELAQELAQEEVAGPRVPGFARFHAADSQNAAAGGRLLIGELNCIACHKTEEPIGAWVASKPAPVLDAVASRVQPDYLRRFLADPQAVDPGTTMPDVFAGVDAETRDVQVEALVHFLATGGTVAELRSDPSAVKRGETLFHTIGCAVCHGGRNDDTSPLPTDVPLNDLGAKYGIRSLADFLRTPHEVRPGGRMPSLGLTEKQALDIAHFLIPDANPKPQDPRLTYRVYDGSFGNLPDFETLQPIAEGQSDGFDLHVAGKSQNYAIVFEGFLKIETAGEYWFLLASDDGSKLFIDGELVSDNDGIHANMTVRGATTLESGVHPVRVEYAQVSGEQSLSVQYEAAGLARQPLANAVYLTPEAKRIKRSGATSETEKDFRLDPALAVKGRDLFGALGCASCHQKQQGETAIAATNSAPALVDVLGGIVPGGASESTGCLSRSVQAPAVDYGLTSTQRSAIGAALTTFAVPLANASYGPPTPAERVDAAFEQFNCYACHDRGGKGGVEPERDVLFLTTAPEMGDEGRIPPALDGIGDKLNLDWMKHLLEHGANDRKSMRTRMPDFGSDNVGFLAEALADLDQRTEVTFPALGLPEHRVESIGRELVGESALSCIKCHDFGHYSSTGIRAIDLQTMTRRLRRDWFVRYMLDPQKYRPGTRMPSSFRQNNRSAVKAILDGASDRQLVAIWNYLELGEKAPVPAGVVHSSIVLAPKDRPILYRAFLEGVSPRGIAVGYPEKANLAFDADELCLALIWHNDFIDASMHWTGRGSGFQRPLGDHVLSLVRGVPLAVLPEDSTVWPGEPAKEHGWQFRGYSLDSLGRPRFRYETESLFVSDVPEPIPAEKAGTANAVLRRSIAVVSRNDGTLPDRLFFRAAVGQAIDDLGDGRYRVDEAYTIRVIPSTLATKDQRPPFLRESEGKQELLIPAAPALPGGDLTGVQIEYEW